MSEKVKQAPLRPVSRLRHYRQRFTKGAAYIWRRRINFNGEETVVGGLCPQALLDNPKKLRLFWEAKTIELAVFDGNNPGAKHMRKDGTEKPKQDAGPAKPAEPAKAEDLVSGANRKWNVKGLEEVFSSKGAATKAASELLEKQAADAAAKKAAEEAAAAEKAKEEQSDEQSDETVLLGSNLQPSEVEIKPGEKVQLGDVVAFAHKASGLSVEDWNALEDADREARLEQAIVDMGKEEDEDETDPLED